MEKEPYYDEDTEETVFTVPMETRREIARRIWEKDWDNPHNPFRDEDK